MAYTTTDIRNICLVGPGSAGKTQLTEALLHAGGAIPHSGAAIRLFPPFVILITRVYTSTLSTLLGTAISTAVHCQLCLPSRLRRSY
jgi:hypothetical protein